APIQSTSPPAISGNTTVAQTLTLSDGTWTGTITNLTYQWQRCDQTGANCTPITGATTNHYTLTDQDAGSAVRVLVTASGPGVAGDAVTAATDAVIPAAPANTDLPQVVGQPQADQTLAATTGTWSSVVSTYAYQWLRCDGNGEN